MKYKIINKSNSLDFGQFKPILSSFLKYAGPHIGFQKPPSLFFASDGENAQLPLGKTAHYDPSAMAVTVYTDKRHPKDILRSLSHELVHHKQNCDGQFDELGEMGEGYAQNDEHLRSMEEEAYLVGNMCFRDWEDTHKKQLQESSYYSRGDKKMKLFEWKNAEMASLIREKFNIPEIKVEEEDDMAPADALKEDSGEEEDEHYDRNVEHDDDHISAIRHHLDALEHDKDYDEGHIDEGAEESEEGEKKKAPAPNAPSKASFGSRAKERMKARHNKPVSARVFGGVTEEDNSLDEARVRKAVREALKKFLSKR